MNLIQQLAETGIAYLLLAISLIAIYTLFKMLLKEKDKRYDDSLKWSDGNLDIIRQVKENGNLHTQYLKQILEKLKI